MDITLYNKLGDELKEKFFAFCAEYLPGSEPEKMKHYEKMFPEAFLAADGILTLYINVISGVTVYPKVIERHLREELPFMATENILMHCVMKGGDRQTLHEAIRRHSVAAGKAIKQDGADNDLLDRIAADPVFSLTRAEIDEIIAKSNFTGLAAEQTEDYLAEVRAVLAENADMLSDRPNATVNV